MIEFLNMGGYGAYVWPSYALTALILGVVAYESWRSYRAAQNQVRALEKRQADEGRRR
ncbi:MAG: heme exporter protein CcmD [Alphaproteobacteria bacterium]|nr:MAG: heme exporter protein CcmD [Alphaproteobacteria bacterium]